jgi:hypothetical protein
MTEAEWFAAADPLLLLPAAERVASLRKLRLLMAGVCRRGWARYGMPAVNRAIDCAELYADGVATDSMVAELRGRIGTGWFWGIPAESLLCPAGQEVSAVRTFLTVLQNSSPPQVTDGVSAATWAIRDRAARANLLRDVVGNPFRSGFDPEWLTSTVVQLAEQMYGSRDFSAMPILADALQDAACDDILAHCRGPGPHVRGCWVVDLVLGKE